MPKPKEYLARNDYGTSIECPGCGTAIHENVLISVSKDKVRCPNCEVVFELKAKDIR